MADLKPMTPESAERFLASQPYADRIHVSLVGKHGGFQPVPILSVAEFVKVTTGLNPVLAAADLAQWVTDQLGDGELGEAIRTECADKPLFQQAPVACALVAARMAEAETVLGSGTPPQA